MKANKQIKKHFRKLRKSTRKLTNNTGTYDVNGNYQYFLMKEPEVEYQRLISSIVALIETGTKFTIAISGNEFVNGDANIFNIGRINQ
jgi:hypothetical protein